MLVMFRFTFLFFYFMFSYVNLINKDAAVYVQFYPKVGTLFGINSVP
jgi:hypothetical protein